MSDLVDDLRLQIKIHHGLIDIVHQVLKVLVLLINHLNQVEQETEDDGLHDGHEDVEDAESCKLDLCSPSHIDHHDKQCRVVPHLPDLEQEQCLRGL